MQLCGHTQLEPILIHSRKTGECTFDLDHMAEGGSLNANFCCIIFLFYTMGFRAVVPIKQPRLKTVFHNPSFQLFFNFP